MLFRFLPPDAAAGPSRVEWWRPGDPAGAVAAGRLADLAAAAGRDRLTLVIPTEQVLLTSVRLPARRRWRATAWRQALPYALEERLADEVESLQFTPLGAQPGAGEETAVCVLRRRLLQGWCETVATAGLNLAAVVPDVLLLPYPDDGWSVAADGRRWLVRNGPWSGFACDQSALDSVFRLALDAAEPRPRRLRYWGAPPPLAGCDLAPQPQPAAALTELLTPARSFNLLLTPTGAAGSSLRERLRPWRLAAALAGVWCAAQLAQQGVNYRQLQRYQAGLDAQTETLFRQALPQARRMINPRVQMENRLRELRANAAAGGDFLPLLAAGGQGLRRQPQIALRGLRFADGRLDFLLYGERFEDFERLDRLLSEAGYSVELQTRKREQTVESRMTLSRP